MEDRYQIENTAPGDLEFIFTLFDQSISYQQKNGYPDWKNYDRSAIRHDMQNKNQYKIIIDAETGIVFSVGYTDKLIWRARDKGDAIYLHRIVVNPSCKGRKLFGVILDWAVTHVKQKGLDFIRMDTWAANENIIRYYESFGFAVVENYTTPNTAELPVHNRNLAMTLLEYKP